MKNAHWQADVQQLKDQRLFQNVAAHSLRQVLREFTAYDLEQGEVLLSPFDRNQYLYLVVRGALQVYLGSLDNQPMSTLGVGDCAGEISFIDHEHPSAYVVAAEPSTVLRLHREALLKLFQQSPQMMQNLLELLCERVRGGNRVILDTEQNANVDTLTGLYNRRWLEHVYARESTRCAFNGQPLCLLMLDVDHFKAYNDRHGHLAGDYALCLVAHTLRNQLRPKDSMSRFGGEEFVILLPDIALDEARRIGERLRASLEQISSFYSPVGVLPGVTVSIGLTEMDPRDDLKSLIARADQALYDAKMRGRNCLSG
ncbi:GGDEF domain-containing protein [Metapseudomonas otitidis]|jgi:diguanylate cyclase (GGDEF)-like protein|uniref:diguanylate cyclase n=1 Tax=Metapseudomonas otitidis TaxID=319939 RepID=A0A1I0UDI6_9GAMM|nr:MULTISPECIES: GGDEF domain-containing protein [Pseudomonas]MDL5596277.1 GGDEF domain-containing protein [Bacillus subtilis]KIV63929.1 diguanylate cyclase/phosphodiesterase (GGDEF & EAL domains) with PAS/PAC sensor(s) [Pseudomonas sp. FeS53a]MBO2929527.1 GGDEF domain-containing protein [Pseudomonas otitidis]MCO7555528.1 GGDEF domain-containing protein [Pseudomonas otitidis]MCP1620462.1 diguanylate cyclase (GGDEF)-like protein [Pseudomonas otitidis]